jgi:hypothetical protein
MGLVRSVYVGPFGRFVVPEGKPNAYPPRDDKGEFLFWDDLIFDKGLDWPRPPGSVYCFMPEIDMRPAYPDRELHFSGSFIDGVDLTCVDRAAEVEWFAAAYASELNVLARYFGGDPSLHWGIVAWTS